MFIVPRFLLPTRRLAAVAMTALLLPAGLALAFQATAIPGWGDPLDPEGGSQIRAEGKGLAITLPEAPRPFTAELPASKNQIAPTVLRDVEGNFSVQVKVGGRAEAAGLLVWQDERNFVILARAQARDGGKPTLVFDYWKDGQKQAAPELASGAKLGGESSSIRLTRRMDKLRAEVSDDGEHWRDAGTTFIRLPSRMRLGVIATGTGAGGTATFEGWQQKAISLYPSS